MKMLISISFSIFCLATAIAMSVPDSIDEQWKMFKIQFHKNYKSEAEETTRKLIFAKQIQEIARHNERFDKREVSFKKGVNQFTDLADDEISQMRKYSHHRDHEVKNNAYENNSTPSEDEEDFVNLADLPDTFDWREKKAVTKVKDQGACESSSWAFSAIGVLEAHLFNLGKPLTELSVQELIDCSKSYGNSGCYGGTVEKAFRFIEENGISTENSYPYQGQETNGEKCSEKLEDGIPKNSKITCKPFNSDLENTRMKQEVATKGPILAMVDASLSSFIDYDGTFIYDDEACSKTGNHNVLIVGYGVENSVEYWIVKNSWGESWGEKGYMRIKRNNNTCGIASNATYINVQLNPTKK